jgi:thiosulfate reductase cytochrome b subunit
MYQKFERLWHWLQALLIFFLALTGFEIHGSFSLFGYQNAAVWHTYAGIAEVILFAFGAFWFFTTRIWKAYVPTTKGLIDQMMFYAKGIFNHEPHPYKKTPEMKLNPLQRLTYLAFGFFMMPLMIITGVIYVFVVDGTIVISPFWLSIIHTFGAFLIIAFVITHIYMTTTGHTILADTKAMITGYEELDDEEHHHHG